MSNLYFAMVNGPHNHIQFITGGSVGAKPRTHIVGGKRICGLRLQSNHRSLSKGKLQQFADALVVNGIRSTYKASIGKGELHISFPNFNSDYGIVIDLRTKNKQSLDKEITRIFGKVSSTPVRFIAQYRTCTKAEEFGYIKRYNKRLKAAVVRLCNAMTLSGAAKAEAKKQKKILWQWLNKIRNQPSAMYPVIYSIIHNRSDRNTSFQRLLTKTRIPLSLCPLYNSLK